MVPAAGDHPRVPLSQGAQFSNTSTPLVSTTATGIRIAVRAQPKAGRDAIEGLREGTTGPRLSIKVTAAPDRGRANAAIEKLLAKALGVPPSSVSVVIGDTGREKIVEVKGEPAALRAKFEEILPP